MALPNAVFAAVFLITWINPTALADLMVRHLMLIVLLEFILVHSAPFLGSAILAKARKREKVKGILFLGGMYMLFVLGFALAFERWWPIWVFAVLLASKLFAVFVTRASSEKQRELFMANWGAGTAFYLLTVAVTTVAPVPEFGVTRAVRNAQDLPGEGLWIDEPHRVVAAGCFYFLLLAVFQFVMHLRFRRRMVEIRPHQQEEPKLSCEPTREKPSRV